MIILRISSFLSNKKMVDTPIKKFYLYNYYMSSELDFIDNMAFKERDYIVTIIY